MIMCGNTFRASVSQYDAWADSDETEEDGHGTSIAGIIAGARNPSKAYTRCLSKEGQQAGGIARAKIAFYDVGHGTNKALHTP